MDISIFKSISEFPFLIGRIRTVISLFNLLVGDIGFPFLIGRIRTVPSRYKSNF